MTKQNGKWTLARDHAYYYQVQTQLGVCKLSYCDFVVWTEKGIAMERIAADVTFFESALDSARNFFIYGVLPEIIGKWYTRKTVEDSSGVVPLPDANTHGTASTTSTDDQEDYETAWCYCSQPSFGTMIKCDNAKCTIQWFHCECLRIRHPPKGKWYCPACRKLPQFTRKQKRKGKGLVVEH